MYVVKKGKTWTILGCPNKRAPDVVVLMERKCSSTVRFWGTVLSFFHTNPFRRPKNGILLQISQVLFAPTTKKMLWGLYSTNQKQLQASKSNKSNNTDNCLDLIGFSKDNTVHVYPSWGCILVGKLLIYTKNNWRAKARITHLATGMHIQ